MAKKKREYTGSLTPEGEKIVAQKEYVDLRKECNDPITDEQLENFMRQASWARLEPNSVPKADAKGRTIREIDEP